MSMIPVLYARESCAQVRVVYYYLHFCSYICYYIINVYKWLKKVCAGAKVSSFTKMKND